MIIFERLGGWGLGNSLFQIATTVAIAKNNNTTYGFPIKCNYKKIRYDTDCKFKYDLPWVDLIDTNTYKRWGTAEIGYFAPPSFNTDTIIDGFFQSEKYFKHIKPDLINLFSLKDHFQEQLKEEYFALINNNDTCAISFRRGLDYAKSKEMKFLDLDYYQKAISLAGKNLLYIVFSDDLNWCKQNLDFIKHKVFVTAKDNVLDLHLMSMFKKNIIANSTFSWWGAWLGSDTQVYMPNPQNNWFSDQYYHEHQYNKNLIDLQCENWTIV